LRIARLASPTVAPGQIQTVDVQSTANTALVAFRIMPNGTQSLLRATTNASGAATISFKQPGSAITRHSRIARVAVRVGSDPQDREVSASYTIAFGKIDLAVDRHTPVRPGSEASIWVHTAARIRVDLSAHAAGHRATGMHASTGANGWVKFVFTVPRGTGANQRVSLTATARRSGKLYAAKTKLTVA
jgi:hypothetical protein